MASNQSDILNATFAALLTSWLVHGEGKGRSPGQRATINYEGQTRRSEVKNQDIHEVRKQGLKQDKTCEPCEEEIRKSI